MSDQSKIERKRLKKRPPRIPRSSRSDYSWVFWDPTSEGQRRYNEEREQSMLHHLPRWMRSSPFGPTAPISWTRRDIETGHKARNTWADSSETRVDEQSPDSSATNAGYETSSDSATIKMRRRPGFSSLCWRANSEDVARATNTQLLAPTAGTALVNLFHREDDPEVLDTSRSGTSRVDCTMGSSNSSESPSLKDAITAYAEEQYLRSVSSTIRYLPHPCNDEGHSLPVQRSIRSYRGREDVPRSSAVSFNDPPTSPGGSEIVVPKKRNKRRSTDDTTAAAERMSMIDTPVDNVGIESSRRDPGHHAGAVAEAGDYN
ncbi:MAG: hypothetical protein Q9220_006650 [cf. Caloplaca sp. 1 TL-2023]